mmetsp:Transcript_12503/g.27727  ORF Transcript_12503/g.27727 Transcript_12503/m.27727 type:complete len:427 (-) Transcript_12503:99-1379(-)
MAPPLTSFRRTRRRRFQLRSTVGSMILAASQIGASSGFVHPARHRRSLDSQWSRTKDERASYNRRHCPPSRTRSVWAPTARGGLLMIRNVDLPECVIFYGTDSILDCGSCSDDASSSSSTTAASCAARPGVSRLLNECREVGTPALLLTEHQRIDELQQRLSSIQNSEDITEFLEDGALSMRSSLDECVYAPSHPYYDDPDASDFYGLGNHAPSPGFILDAIESISMIPLGFGGSSGFGVKQEGVERRPPLPKHCVVLVSGPDSRPADDDDGIDAEAIAESVGAAIRSNTVSRARCTAGKLAGARVLYLEHMGLGTADAEDLADAIVPGLGSDDDWEVVSLDDIATPGSYWLNPPVSRDEDGNRVNLIALCSAFQDARSTNATTESSSGKARDDAVSTSTKDTPIAAAEDMSEDEMARILADLDAL